MTPLLRSACAILNASAPGAPDALADALESDHGLPGGWTCGGVECLEVRARRALASAVRAWRDDPGHRPHAEILAVMAEYATRRAAAMRASRRDAEVLEVEWVLACADLAPHPDVDPRMLRLALRELDVARAVEWASS